MKLPRGILSLLTVLLLFLGIGGAVAWRLLASDDTDAEATGPDLPDIEGVEVVSANQFMGAQPVEGVAVVRDTLWIRAIASGEAVASRLSTVATRAPGVVQRVYVRENSAVSRGQLLVQLDTVEAAIRLTRARNELRRAQIQFEEAMLRSGSDILTPEARAQRESILRAEILTGPELNVTEAEIAMELTQVRAPFGGRVADLVAVEGAYLGTGQDVLTLVQLDPIHVEANLVERYMGYVAPGRRAQITFTALPGEVYTATVLSVNPRIDTESRAGRVTLELSNADGRILPGFYAQASLDAEAFPDRVLVPREAVLQRGDTNRDMVFLLKGADDQGVGLADWKYVTIGRRNDTHVEIIPSDDTDMLEPGQIVLVDGHHYLAHDAAVRIVENVSAAGGRPGR